MKPIIDQLLWMFVVALSVAMAVMIAAVLLGGCGDNESAPLPDDCCALMPDLDIVAWCGSSKLADQECGQVTCEIEGGGHQLVPYCNYPTCASLGCADAALCNAVPGTSCTCAGQMCTFLPRCSELNCDDGEPSGDPREWQPCDGDQCWCRDKSGFAEKCEVR